MTADSRTAEEALARALHEAGWGPDDRLFASEIVARLAEAGYRIEGAGLREAAQKASHALHEGWYALALYRAGDDRTVRQLLQARDRLDAALRTPENPEAADWRNAAIEAGGTGEIRPGGGVAKR